MPNEDKKIIANWRHEGDREDLFQTKLLKNLKAETHDVGGKGEKTRKSKPYMTGTSFYHAIEECFVMTEKDHAENDRLFEKIVEARLILDDAKTKRQAFLKKAVKRARPLTVKEATVAGVNHDDGSMPGLPI